MVDGSRLPKPHSVAIEKPLTCRSAVASRFRVPATPSVKWTSPRLSSVSGFNRNHVSGERSDWITWLEPVFANNPAFEKSGEFFRVHAQGTGRERYRLKPGLRLQHVRFDNLFYADIAKTSYAAFKRVKSAGKIAEGTRFQVDLVPAHSVIWLFLVDELHAAIDPIYNAVLKREIDKIAAVIPHHELAIQFDVASAVFARLERNQASGYGRNKAEMQETFSQILVDLGNHVPADIDLLYHLCYGDSGHHHV